jgi:hypothetical protein
VKRFLAAFLFSLIAMTLHGQVSLGTGTYGSMSIVTDNLSNLTASAVTRLQTLKTTAANWSYGSTLQLGTNQAPWSWPYNLSCVGLTAAAYQECLIAPNAVVTVPDHDDGGSITFTDTNGVRFTARFISTNTVFSFTIMGNTVSMGINILESNMPPSVVTPWVLPPGNYSNILANCQGFWVHKNTITIDYAQTSTSDGNYYAPELAMRQGGINRFNGTSPSGGDSGSPSFMVVNNNLVYIQSVADTVWDGILISDRAVMAAVSAVVNTNTMKIIPPGWIGDYAR